jgi:hypothetical protein
LKEKKRKKYDSEGRWANREEKLKRFFSVLLELGGPGRPFLHSDCPLPKEKHLVSYHAEQGKKGFRKERGRWRNR